MRLDDLQKKLISAARQNPPSERVPYAFERRVLARLAAIPPYDDSALWRWGLWSGAWACVFVALLAGVVSFTPSHACRSDLQRDLEQTILASVDDIDTAW